MVFQEEQPKVPWGTVFLRELVPKNFFLQSKQESQEFQRRFSYLVGIQVQDIASTLLHYYK
jgi:hypothetical protein